MTEPNPAPTEDSSADRAEYHGKAISVRAIIGGLLMGLANLVPGISGGTMLLAVGIYPQFINGVAEVSTFKFKARTIIPLVGVIGGAVVAIVGFAGIVGNLVIHQRWLMYSLFIGLTFGGVPILWRMLKPLDPIVVIASIVGIMAMAGLAFVEPGTTAASASESRQYAMLLIAGIAGGSAMILPGVSGGYLLLILGQYVTILTAIGGAKDAAQAGDWSSVMDAMHVFIPVGIGVIVGVVGVSNLVKILLAKFERVTLGVLLGLLLGAVIGLWPFKEAVPPELGDTIKGVVLTTQAMVDDIAPKDWRTERFGPTILQSCGSVGIIVIGFVIASIIAHFGETEESPDTSTD